MNEGFMNVGSSGRDESLSYRRLVFFIIVSIFANDISELIVEDDDDNCSPIIAGRSSINVKDFPSSLRCFHKNSERISPSGRIA